MPTTIIRPSSLQSSTQLAANSGTIITALSDNSDATWVKMSPEPNFNYGDFTVQLQDISLAGNQLIYGLRVNVRNALNSSTAKASEKSVWWLLNTSNIGTTALYETKTSTTTITTRLGPWWTTNLQSGNPWVQSVVNNARLYGQLVADAAPGYSQFVYDVWLEVLYLTQPSVTGTPTVTNFTNNAQPTVSWVYNGIDSISDPQTVGPQVAYRVKIFDAATIAAAGFSPNTSTPAWHSGEKAGSGSSTLTGPLQSGITYTAYVEVAKLSNDYTSNWWSNWATSATFTPTFSAPTAPVISNLLVLAEECRYRAVMDIFAPVNLLTANAASVETDATGWSALSNCAVSRSTTPPPAAGIAVLQLSSSAAGTMQAISSNSTTPMRVDKGVTYTALASFRTAVSARTCNVGIRWLKNDRSTVISTAFGSNITDTAVGWTQASFTQAAPDGAVWAQVVLQVVSAAAASEIHYADQMDLHAGSGTSWTAGGYSNQDTSTGTVYNGVYLERRDCVDDARGPAYNWFNRQIASTGSVTPAAGITPPGFSWDTVNSTVEWIWLDTLIGQSGYVAPGALRWTNVVGAAGQHLDFGNDLFTTDWRYAPSVVASQAHTFSCWGWTDTGTRTLTPQIVWLDGTGAVISTSSGSNVTINTTPQRLQCTATAPANAVYAYGKLLDTQSTVSPHMSVSTAGFGFGSLPVDNKEPMGLPVAVWSAVHYVGSASNPLWSGTAVGYNTGQTETLPDFEIPPVRPVVYRASVTYFDPNGGNTITSAYSNRVTAYGPTPTRTLVQSVTDSTLGCVVNRRKSMTSSHVFDAQVYHPLGADGAPVQVRDWVGAEDASLEIIISTEAQMQRLTRLLTTSDVLVVQWAQGGRSYITITAVQAQETMSGDATVCDADGTTGNLRYSAISLTYIETVSPQLVA